MLAGRLRHRVTLMRPTVNGRDPFNAPRPGWLSVGGARGAAVEELSDGERVRAAQTGAKVTNRFQVRASSDIADMDRTWRLEYRGRPFEIRGLKQLFSRAGALEGYEITAEAQGSAA